MGIETALIVTAVAGAAASAYSKHKAGKAAKKAGKANADVAERNALLAEQAAQEAEEAGVKNVDLRRTQLEQEVGSSRTNAAARGVMVDRGSEADFVEDLRDAADRDTFNIAVEAQREARDLRARGEDFTAEAQLSRSRGNAAAKAANIDAAATGISGLASVAGTWNTYNSAVR